MPPPTPKGKAIARIPRLPQEIWDIVAHKIPSVALGHASHILGFKIRPEQQPITDLWSTIFKDDKWLNIAIEMGKKEMSNWRKMNPALIGRDLEKLLSGNHSGKGCYLVFVAHTRLPDICYEKEQLMRSLMPHTFEKEKQEIVFPNGLRVNILNVYSDCSELSPVRLDKLFEYREGRLQTSYLNYLDERTVSRDVGPEGIVGIGGQATKINKVKKVCGVTLTLPDGERMQHLFRKRGVRYANITPIGNTRTNQFEGWKKYQRHRYLDTQPRVLRFFAEHILAWGP